MTNDKVPKEPKPSHAWRSATVNSALVAHAIAWQRRRRAQRNRAKDEKK